ncbi:MAG TPA: lantibiotic dehydratase [Ktedonobacteraceae bacterium]|nr:lantibiotic dehydratase [Ktedonobacteraceae bacterium]
MQNDDSQKQQTSQADVPAHLVPLANGEWAIWRWIGLRSAGFSHDDLRPLVVSACAAAADRYLSLEQQAETTVDELTAARREFERAYQEASLQTFHALRQIASSPSFREAVIWQNRQALHTGVDLLLHAPPELSARTASYRKKEALVSSYIQRYCTKNDTIGFFGPIGWAHCVDQGPLLSVQPGPVLLASRTIYFEGWCIDALAEQLARDEAFLPWLCPRLFPHIRLSSTHLHPPLAPPIALEPRQAAVLKLCDGRRSARQIALSLLSEITSGFQTETEVYALLRDLRARRRIAWTLEISAEGMRPEQRLRDCLACTGDDELRSLALAALDQLEQGKEALMQARGDVERLDQAMADLEETFIALTGREATRYAGAAYAGRSLVYEDCQRDVQVEIGPEIVSTLGSPLSLLLTSARWFTCEAAALFGQAFQEIFTELAARKSLAVVPFSDFWFHAHALLFDQHHALLATLRQRLQLRWQAILAPPLDEHRVSYRVEDLRAAVSEAFAAPRPGWQTAFYHSPDLMIATPSLEALRKGDYYYILGELHPGGNTLRAACFSDQHPLVHELRAASEADCPAALVQPVFSREIKGVTTRLCNAFVRPWDWRLTFAGDSCGVAPGQEVRISHLEIERRGEKLVVSTHDQLQHWNLLDLLGDFLVLQIMHAFSLLPPADHTPRITLERLVVQRETWRFAAQDMRFPFLSAEAERFLEVRRWMHAHDLPRHVFVKVPSESKPFFVDFANLASIDVCARALRRAAKNQEVITVSEMLPDLHETWLVDGQQRPYTSELRLVAVDRCTC